MFSMLQADGESFDQTEQVWAGPGPSFLCFTRSVCTRISVLSINRK